MIMEDDPHSLIEGMIVGGYAAGANHGYIYIREEYPLAFERLQKASHKMAEALYRAAGGAEGAQAGGPPPGGPGGPGGQPGGGPGGGGGGQDDVIDAEYTESPKA